MDSLAWLFFCLSPFALFCSGNGNGIFLCIIFVILGFVCKAVGNSSGADTYTIKVKPSEFWELQYRQRMSSTFANKDSMGDFLVAARDKEARDWASTICRYHNAWIPPKDKQEQIARECGVITDKMLKEQNKIKDRVQLGKFYLLKELQKKYEGKKYKKKGTRQMYICPSWEIIKKDCYKIKLSNGREVNVASVEYDYKMTIGELVSTFSEEEKKQATQWIEEYERKMLEQLELYMEDKCISCKVDIDF